jgi:hypothetical protein
MLTGNFGSRMRLFLQQTRCCREGEAHKALTMDRSVDADKGFTTQTTFSPRMALIQPLIGRTPAWDYSEWVDTPIRERRHVSACGTLDCGALSSFWLNPWFAGEAWPGD